MKCSNCGKDNSDYVSFCESCGAILGRQETVTEQKGVAPIVPRAYEHPPAEISTPLGGVPLGEPVGIGGWLGFVCVSLTILTPLSCLLVLLESLFQPHLGFDRLLSTVAFGVLGVYSFITGLRLWRVKPNAVKGVRLFFAVSAGISSVLIIIDAARKSNFTTPILQFVSLAIGYLIQDRYFTKSRRVRNTYKA